MSVTSPSRRVLVVALCCYSAVLAAALLAPTSGTQSELASWVRDLGTGVGLSPETATQDRAEFLCNALILAPVSALGSWLWPRSTWRDWTAAGFVIAAAVEMVQGLLLADRTASYEDIVANTLGALLGALVAGGVRRIARRGPQGS